MNAATIIRQKRDGGELTDQQIGWFVAGYVAGEIPDYQMSAFAMAVYFQGMSTEETASLTRHMLRSGATFSWPEQYLPRADKHSTGGVGDKVSLVLAPLLAAAGLAVPMISGRGLGATGGTLDKLESMRGFRTDLSREEIRHTVDGVGCVITGATDDLVPADAKLYALRDVTATVASIPLITASILSKKLAEGLSVLVLDVKYGSGAFMKTLAQARALARSLVEAATQLGTKTVALITDMNQPLGGSAGCAVEVREALASLAGEGPEDLREITLCLAAEALCLAGTAADPAEARQRLQGLLDTGEALERFGRMVRAQGGDSEAPLTIAAASLVCAPRAGSVAAVDTQMLGEAVIAMGGGRRKLGDAIDHAVGLEMLVRIGDQVDAQQPLVRMFAPAQTAADVSPAIQAAIRIEDQPQPLPPLIVERVTAASVGTTPPPRDHA